MHGYRLRKLSYLIFMVHKTWTHVIDLIQFHLYEFHTVKPRILSNRFGQFFNITSVIQFYFLHSLGSSELVKNYWRSYRVCIAFHSFSIIVNLFCLTTSLTISSVARPWLSLKRINCTIVYYLCFTNENMAKYEIFLINFTWSGCRFY